jgi:type IX secretion system PorP/SprF family membrane protein
VEAQYVYNSMNFREFTFGDQLNLDGANAPVSIEEMPSEEVAYLDVSASLLFYNSKYWFGTTAKHLLEPNQSFLGYSNFKANATMEFSGYGGVKFNMAAKRARREESITVTFLYKNKPKENWDQLDLGFYYTRDPLMLGAWFRGLPGVTDPQGGEIEYLDAVIMMAGFKIKDALRIGYSYDFTVSDLWNANTGGSHELSLVFEFNRQIRLQRRRRYETIACPSF